MDTPSIPLPRFYKGRVLEWNVAKGYGFIDHDGQRLFAHIRDFDERHTTPRTGDLLIYSLGTDSRGRSCAKDIMQPNDGGRLRVVHWVVVLLLLIIPSVAVWCLLPLEYAFAALGWWLIASCISHAVYAQDKRNARVKKWRTSESTLHLWDLLGGWAGGFIAQRRLRHKCSKASFQFTFWLTVLAYNYAALDWLLGWKIFRQVATWITHWLSTIQ